ncbi:MAG: chemotaxis response regulator protein-glutamate methylesterase [Mucispirillum sp.]|nr:chemotaxis response regulator protein-glutamate methylesterase [Mucispirillum sp.]
MNKIKVLVVDDSIFMRKALESLLSGESDIEIVGLAKNGKEGVEMAEQFHPDVITMDIEMPTMDGITALELIMKKNPTPVIMVSSLTKEGADATLKALDLGAVDFMTKDSQSFGGADIEKGLKDKIRKFAKNKGVVRLLTHSASSHTQTPSYKLSGTFAAQAPQVSTPFAHGAQNGNVDGSKRVIINKTGIKRVVALGTSTGGPQSLQRVIPLLPADLGVPVVVTQHMPPNFTQSLASRLNTLSKVEVVEAQGKEKLEPNVVYIAKGGYHLKFKKVGPSVYTELSTEPSNVFNIPGVDVMVDSIAELYGKECLGVIMTGMGSDGCKGLTNLKKIGGTIIAQNEPTCIVYGMPRAVVEAGIADEIVPLDEIAARIAYHVK